jgi:hypothetical protein
MAIYRGSGGSLDGQTESLSFPVSISQGGTGQTDPNKAFNALAPTQQFNSGKYLKTDGANTSWDNIEINTADISGVLAVGNGGTGASNESDARTNLGLAIGTDVPSPTGTGASGTWAIDVTGNAATVTNGVYTTGDQTIAGIKTFSSTIVGDINGNAATVTNGIYSTGSYTNPSWIVSLDGSKLTGTVVATNGIVSTGSYADPAWITSLAGSKITGNISGNAANVTGTVAVANGGTGATTAANARVNLLPSYTGNAGKVLGLNGTATDVEWISSAGSGSVTSVAFSAPTGFDVSGSPITSTGTIALTFSSGYSLPTTTKQAEWDTAYTDRLKWDGGSTGLNAATARTSLGLVIGTDVQAYDAQLADVAGLTPTDNGVIIGNGTNFVTESGSTLRTSLGLGSIATQDSSNVSITGGTLTGVSVTAGDAGFTLQDDADATKQAQFQLSGITTATTRTYTLPNVTGTLATISNLAQTFAGNTTFSNATVTVGSSTGAATYGLGTGATTNGTTKTINIGTAGVSGSTTNINIGSAVSGALGTTTINSATVALTGTLDSGTINGGTY